MSLENLPLTISRLALQAASGEDLLLPESPATRRLLKSLGVDSSFSSSLPGAKVQALLDRVEALRNEVSLGDDREAAVLREFTAFILTAATASQFEEAEAASLSSLLRGAASPVQMRLKAYSASQDTQSGAASGAETQLPKSLDASLNLVFSDSEETSLALPQLEHVFSSLRDRSLANKVDDLLTAHGLVGLALVDLPALVLRGALFLLLSQSEAVSSAILAADGSLYKKLASLSREALEAAKEAAAVSSASASKGRGRKGKGRGQAEEQNEGQEAEDHVPTTGAGQSGTMRVKGQRQVEDAGEYVPGSRKERSALKRLFQNQTVSEASLPALLSALARLAGEAALAELGSSFITTVDAGVEASEGEDKEAQEERVVIWPQVVESLHFLSKEVTEGHFPTVRRLVERDEQNLSEACRQAVSSLLKEAQSALTSFVKSLEEVAESARPVWDEALRLAVEAEKNETSTTSSASIASPSSATSAGEAGGPANALDSQRTPRERLVLEATAERLLSAAGSSLSKAVETMEQAAAGAKAAHDAVSRETSAYSAEADLLLRLSYSLRQFTDHMRVPLNPKAMRSKSMTLGFAHEWEMARLKTEAKRKSEESEDNGKLKKLAVRVPVTEFVRRGGRDVSDIQDEDGFVRQFDIKGVQFGDYVADKRRSDILQRASASLRDLADVLGVKDGALGLGGASGEKKLAFSFGARGNGGKASATYGIKEHVINLTRDKGDGGISHEFFHALDFLGKTSAILDPDGRDDLPESVREAFLNLKKAMMTCPKEEFITRRTAEANEAYSAALKNKKEYQEASVAIEKIEDDGMQKIKEELQKSEGRTKEEIKEIISQAQKRLYQQKRESLYKIEYKRLRCNRLLKFAKALRYEVRMAELDYSLRGRKSISNRSAKLPLAELEKMAAEGEVLYPSKFLDDAVDLDDGKKKYYSTDYEMGARAFETFVAQSLASDERQNNYLVDERSLGGYKKSPYPMDADRTRINEAILELLAAVKKAGLL